MKPKDKQTELLAKHIQDYLAKGNTIKKVEKGVSGDVKRRDGFTRRTIYRS